MSPSTEIESYWRECWYHEDFAGYDINLIDGGQVQHESVLYTDTFFKSGQLRVLLNILEMNKIKSGDTIVFTNAWNFLVIPLTYFKHEWQLDIRIVGFWGNSLYNQESPMWQRFKAKNKSWAREFEYTLYRSYDANFFLTEKHREMFFGKYGWARRNEVDHVTGYPYGYLNINVHPPTKNRDNIVVFPYELSDNTQTKIFKAIENEIPNVLFIRANETHNNRMAYRNLLVQSKVIFSTGQFETNPIVLCEAMLNGVIPVVPNVSMYKDAIPSRYHYSHKLIKYNPNTKFSEFIPIMRRSFQLQDFIKNYIFNYQEHATQAFEDGLRLHERLYSNGPFLKVLKSLH